MGGEGETLVRITEMRWARGLFGAITRFEEVCLAGGILGIAALTIANVLLRATLGYSLLFAEEINRFLIVLVTFVGIGYAASQGRHIRMTALYDLLGERWRKLVMLLITGSTSALLFVFTWLAVEYVLGTVRELGAVSPVLRIPLYLVYLAAPMGLFLAAIQFLLALIKNLTADEVYIAFDRRDQYDEPPPADV
ncbi:MAG: TRAP transporter small permease [Candidatus Binatia bacterium]